MHRSYQTGEHLNLERLSEYWQKLDALHKRVVGLPTSHKMTNAITARRIDEAQPAGNRVYIETDRLLSVAMDNHQSLMALLEKHGASLWAPWSLRRTSFECGLLATWIMDPNDSRERRLRGPQCELRDVLEQHKHLRSFENVPELRGAVLETIKTRREKTEPTYRAEALALGTTYDNLVGSDRVF